MQYEGWALFCDCDFLFRADLNELFKLKDDRYAVMCVKHDYSPQEGVKMDGQIQQSYPRKNWSSLVLWNCGHESNKKLTPRMANFMPGSFLHAFKWLKDSEIGALPEYWNWLEGHSSPSIEPRGVHFTRGTPNFPGYEQVPYADEWRSYLNA
jgi:lipopolysaccharide biosynthesis glycosyltransferase